MAEEGVEHESVVVASGAGEEEGPSATLCRPFAGDTDADTDTDAPRLTRESVRERFLSCSPSPSLATLPSMYCEEEAEAEAWRCWRPRFLAEGDAPVIWRGACVGGWV